MKVEFYRHPIGDAEIEAVSQTLRGIFLTTGERVREFEEQFAQYLGMPYAVGLSSCSAALELTLRCAGVEAGDEVITTPLTFIATPNAILRIGAIPVFVDIEEGTGLIDVEAIEKAITRKTKAILPVHLYGQLCDMKRIRALADRYHLAAIEDAAHCVEGARDGVRPGHLGDGACFSFYATKSLTSGEGGAVAFKNSDWLPLLQKLRSQGMSQDASSRYGNIRSHWDMEVLGGKFNMNNIQASLLLPQLPKIEVRRREREKRVEYYRKHLEGVPGLKLLKYVDQGHSAHHLFPIFVERERRDQVLFGLREREIGSTVNYNPVHLTTYYRKTFGFREGNFPVAEEMGLGTLSLPLHIYLTEAEQDYVIDSLRKILCVNSFVLE